MVTKKEKYNPTTEYVFLDQKRRAIAQLRKKISKFGIDPNELGIFSRPEYALKQLQRSFDNKQLS